MAITMNLKNILYDRIPILKWYRYHNSCTVLSDVIAGFTVGLTLIPQALAYATLGGLPPQYGLYSSFVGCFIYTIFGSIKDITIGPTALMALLMYQQIDNRNIDYAILLCFLGGIVQLIMATLHLGVLVDFISIPVTVGFTSATSVIIAASQLKGLLGLKVKTSDFIDTITKVFQNIGDSRMPDFLLGLFCTLTLILLKKLKDVEFSKPTRTHEVITYTLWLISTSRNAIVVVICSITAYLYETYGKGSPFYLTGTVRSGLPDFKSPPFYTVVNNHTEHFGEMVSNLGTSIVIVPVIAVLGNVAIAKAFASGTKIDATQELFTLSLCNIVGSFFSSMPVTGSFSRSAVNHASGVQTPLGGVITGLMILLALSFLTESFAYIPNASLAAVIVTAVIFMIQYEVIRPMWRSSKKDLMCTCTTFVACLLIGVEYGILLGVAINLAFLLRSSARPGLYVDQLKTSRGKSYTKITLENSLYFPAVNFIKSNVDKVRESAKHLPVVIDCRFIMEADFTAVKGIAALIQEFEERKQPLYFANIRKEVYCVFESVIQENFQHFTSKEELERQIDGLNIESNEMEDLLFGDVRDRPKASDEIS